MSIRRVLEKAWEDCKMEGVELSSVDFVIARGVIDGSAVCDVEYRGRAIEKPQNRPDE